MQRKSLFVAAALLLLSTFPLSARSGSARWHSVDATPVKLEIVPVPLEFGMHVIRQLQALDRSPVRTSSIIDNRSARSVIIPAAGSVHGNGGAFYHSDITFANWNSTSQRILVSWLPNGANTPTMYTTTFPGDRPPFTAMDFVGATLGTSGLGALLFIPIDSAGNIDPNGAIDAYSRIWTPQPNTAKGSVSQPFSGVDGDHLKGEYEAFILGLRQDADYRTNVGVVNLYTTALTFTVTIYPESAPAGTQLAEMTFTLQPLSMVQKPIPADLYGTPINIGVHIDQDVPGSNQSWTAYASSSDNTTSDGWVSIASKAWDDDSLDTYHPAQTGNGTASVPPSGH